MNLKAMRIRAWLLHLFTASGAFFGVLAIDQIYQQHFTNVFWLITLMILIDAVDGTFARKWAVSRVLPQVDGCLLDNLVDYFTYAIVPAVFFLKTTLLINPLNTIAALFIILASAYQFTQTNAKTDDHFFKGFPSYWNITALYLYYWEFSSTITFFIITACAILSFIPIKYIYPSRLDNLSRHRLIRYSIFMLTLVWGMATILMIYLMPERLYALKVIILIYIAFYFIFSFYRTLKPVSQ